MNRITPVLLLTALLVADCGKATPRSSGMPRAVPQKDVRLGKLPETRKAPPKKSSPKVVPQAKRRAAARSPATRSEVVYEGKSGPGRGKHIVLIAGDREYRSEETIPALARILAKHHGFTCTVLFTIDSETGFIEPESSRSQISGLEALKTADLMVIFIRNQNYANEQMQHIVDYLDAGGPVVGLRTATHAFRIPADSPYAKFSNRYRGESYKRGFGRQILGESWAGHYGKNHRQSTRIDLVNEQASHPILRGVKNAWVQSGGYFANPMPNSTVLALAQPLNGMKPDSPGDATKKPVPTSWTRTYQSKSGRAGRVFTSTHGASEDILNDGYRRMLVNACFWAMGLEDRIRPDLEIRFVGPYNPVTFRAFGHRQGVKPSDLAGWESPIMSKDKAIGKRKPRQKKDQKKQPDRKQK